jgi:acetyl esterase/lipase
MSISETLSSLLVAARSIPVPSSVSPEAQARLAAEKLELPAYPSLDDIDGWKAVIAAQNEAVQSMMLARTSGAQVEVEERQVNGVDVFVITPADHDPEDERIYLDIHGGGLIMGGGAVCRTMAIWTASRVGMRVWAPDYRMPPEYPYPSSLDDCVASYLALLKEHSPAEIVVGGASAGGNLAPALILRARDEGHPLPAAAVLLTPEVDLTESGDSFQTNLGIDNVLTESLMSANLLYAGGQDLTDPYLSPLFGDFSKGFPPTLLASGTRDLFLSNTVRMHRALRAADIRAELHIVEAAPHGGFGGSPEDKALDREVRQFIESCRPPRN